MGVLEYEQLKIEHTAGLVTLWNDKDVIRYTNIKKPCSNEETKDRIMRLEVFEVFAVNYNGDTIGVIGCPSVDSKAHKFGVFYQFKKKYWNKGMATEAVEWLIEYMKEKYSPAILFADVAANNTASEKILVHVGFELLSVLENEFERDGVKMNVKQYSLTI